MKHVVALIVAAAVLLTPSLGHAQQALAAGDEAAAFRQLAASMPLGSRVKVESRDGRRVTATLMAADATAIVIKRESRVPESAISIPYDQLTRLQLDPKNGFSMGKAIGIGLAAGVGAILTIFAIAVSIDD
jgi:hypothetical protein